MAWQKQISQTKTARTGNTDLTARFYFSDAAATPPNELRAEVSVVIDDGYGVTETLTYDFAFASSSLTGPQQTTFKQLAAIIRDDALAALGFTNV